MNSQNSMRQAQASIRLLKIGLELANNPLRPNVSFKDDGVLCIATQSGKPVMTMQVANTGAIKQVRSDDEELHRFLANDKEAISRALLFIEISK